MTNKKQIFLAFFLLIAVVGALIYWTSTRSPQSDGMVIDPAAIGTSFVEGEEVLQMLEILQSTKLDLSLFGDSVFQGLVDYSVDLIPEPVGRENPFLPFDTVVEVEIED